MADIDDFDIDLSIAQAWAEFQARLSEIVSMIDDSADLTIGTGTASEDVAPYLRLSSPQPQLVRGEAASNAVLGPGFQLDAGQLANALGIAGTQAAGLAASFGTMAKPLHPGKAAMNGLLAAMLAREGFTGGTQVIDGPGSLPETYLGVTGTQSINVHVAPGAQAAVA